MTAAAAAIGAIAAAGARQNANIHVGQIVLIIEHGDTAASSSSVGTMMSVTPSTKKVLRATGAVASKLKVMR